MNIYPNPTTGTFQMQLPDVTTKVTVIDVRGITIFEVQTEQPTALTVDLSNHPKGIYLVRVTDHKSVAYRQVLLQ